MTTVSRRLGLMPARWVVHVAAAASSDGAQRCARCGASLVPSLPGARLFEQGSLVLAAGESVRTLVSASALSPDRDRSDEFDCGVSPGRGLA